MKIFRLFIAFTLICFALSPRAQAVVPPPDGGYPNFNTAEGQKALFSLTSGQWNTALGAFTLWQDTGGSYNTAVGTTALLFNNADENTAVGVAALLFNTTGSNNTAVGTTALYSNTTGVANTATGVNALHSNSTGNFNTATGFFALHDNTGSGNTANGASALLHNTTGGLNTGVGGNALMSNTTGADNTATGANALSANTTGHHNSAFGSGALASNTGNGEHNTAVGYNALANNVGGDANTAVGAFALENSTGHQNIGLGTGAGTGVTTANNVICIGANANGADVDNSCFIANIRDVQTQNANAIPVLVDIFGQMGTASSSARFKKEIKPMERASEAILGLKPATFHYKSDNTNTPQFGLIAEEVAEVNSDLVVRDKNGEIYSVRYDAVNAMLLNEFLKEHQKVQELEANDAEQQREIKTLVATVKEQAAQIQKVSAQLEASKPAPQVANNP
jgi:Chaperone of endosialidase